MFRQKGKEINLVFGKPISWETFDNTKSAPEWAEWVKSKHMLWNHLFPDDLKQKKY